MDEVAIRVEDDLSDAEKQFIDQALGEYNDAKSPPPDHRTLSVVLRHNGKLVGGLLGHTHWNWLYIKILWVAEEFRSRGLGRRLMLMAEKEARRRGCANAHCNTYAFQALPFYQKLGFSVFGRLEDYPAGHVRYFLQKRNLSGSARAP